MSMLGSHGRWWQVTPILGSMRPFHSLGRSGPSSYQNVEHFALDQSSPLRTQPLHHPQTLPSIHPDHIRCQYRPTILKERCAPRAYGVRRQASKIAEHATFYGEDWSQVADQLSLREATCLQVTVHTRVSVRWGKLFRSFVHPTIVRAYTCPYILSRIAIAYRTPADMPQVVYGRELSRSVASHEDPVARFIVMVYPNL